MGSFPTYPDFLFITDTDKLADSQGRPVIFFYPEPRHVISYLIGGIPKTVSVEMFSSIKELKLVPAINTTHETASTTPNSVHVPESSTDESSKPSNNTYSSNDTCCSNIYTNYSPDNASFRSASSDSTSYTA